MGDVPGYGVLDPLLKSLMQSVKSNAPIETSHRLPGQANAVRSRALKYSNTAALPTTVAATPSGSSGSREGEKLCSISGCNQPLQTRYQRKYKICGHHVLSPVINMNGVPRRFCQKCSRFQDIAEFDGPKRSCRQSLEAYNERRRRRAKSALAGSVKSLQETSWPNQPREAPSNRVERQPVPEANTNRTEAPPLSWSDFDLCMSDLEDVFGSPLPEGDDALDAIPSLEAGLDMPDGLMWSELEGLDQTGYSEQTLALEFHDSPPRDLPKDN